MLLEFFSLIPGKLNKKKRPPSEHHKSIGVTVWPKKKDVTVILHHGGRCHVQHMVLPERDVAPLKGVPVVPGGAVVSGGVVVPGGGVVTGGGVVGGGAFVAGPPTEMVRSEMHCNDYIVAKILSGSEHS